MSSRFKASGLITLTTDFRHVGPYVGVIKGVILSRFSKAQIVDLTNQSHVHWPVEAGFWIARSYEYFPMARYTWQWLILVLVPIELCS